MPNFLLSTGEITDSPEKYVMDLIKLNLTIMPGDVPLSQLGFNFNLTNTTKDQLGSRIQEKSQDLIQLVRDQFPSVPIEINSIDLVDEEVVYLEVQVGSLIDAFKINIYES